MARADKEKGEVGGRQGKIKAEDAEGLFFPKVHVFHQKCTKRKMLLSNTTLIS